MNKKIIKIVFLNLFLIIVFFLLLDFICYKIISFNELQKSKKEGFSPRPFNYSWKMRKFEEEYDDVFNKHLAFYRRPIIVKSSKRPIIIFGCSFANGFRLKESETIQFCLSKQSKRSIYNRAYPGWGIQHMLYQLKKNDFGGDIKNPEYIIFVFIDDHIQRLFLYVFSSVNNIIYLRYKEASGHLVRVDSRINFYRGSFLIKELQRLYVGKVILRNSRNDKNFNVAKLHFIEAKNEAQKKFPGVKFVILKYATSPNSSFKSMDRWKELEKEGFIILDTKELTGKNLGLNEYRLSDGHPNAKAWQIITPALVKKLNL